MIFVIPFLLVSIPLDIQVTLLDATVKTPRKRLQCEYPSNFNKQPQETEVIVKLLYLS